jgi:hypothetical protein
LEAALRSKEAEALGASLREAELLRELGEAQSQVEKRLAWR